MWDKTHLSGTNNELFLHIELEMAYFFYLTIIFVYFIFFYEKKIVSAKGYGTLDVDKKILSGTTNTFTIKRFILHVRYYE
jgi:hypothetical protein